MKKILFLIFCLFFLIYCVVIEPNRLEITTYQIQDKSLANIKIVMAGDLHIKQYQSKKLDKIVDKINAQNPDIILLVGDYVSGHVENFTLPIETIAAQLGKLSAKYGTYCVLGNHDWWANGEKMTRELEKNNIKVLANSNVKVNIDGKDIYIAGVEDLNTRKPNVYHALKGAKNPTILLTHSPDLFPKIPESVNLTLAGHVHGGQIRIPFIGAVVIPSKYGNRYSQGLIAEKDKKMIVTRGIGTSILPLRFNCSPEIVVIEFN